MPQPARWPRRAARCGARSRAGADLERHGHRHRAHHGRRGCARPALHRPAAPSRPALADFFGRASHVDVDDLRAKIDVDARGARELRRIGADQLHHARLGLAVVVHAPLRLVAAPEALVGAEHFGRRQAAPKRRHSWRKGRSVTPAMGASSARAGERDSASDAQAQRCRIGGGRRRNAAHRRGARRQTSSSKLALAALGSRTAISLSTRSSWPRKARGGDAGGPILRRRQVAGRNALAIAIEQREAQQRQGLGARGVIGQAQRARGSAGCRPGRPRRPAGAPRRRARSQCGSSGTPTAA